MSTAAHTGQNNISCGHQRDKLAADPSINTIPNPTNANSNAKIADEM